jgi:hypothetical protein
VESDVGGLYAVAATAEQAVSNKGSGPRRRHPPTPTSSNASMFIAGSVRIRTLALTLRSYPCRRIPILHPTTYRAMRN